MDNAIARINEFRKIKDLRKEPGTSELIDWIRILCYWQIDAEQIDADKRLTELPFWQSLFKHERDLQRVGRAEEEENKS